MDLLSADARSTSMKRVLRRNAVAAVVEVVAAATVEIVAAGAAAVGGATVIRIVIREYSPSKI